MSSPTKTHKDLTLADLAAATEARQRADENVEVALTRQSAAERAEDETRRMFRVPPAKGTAESDPDTVDLRALEDLQPEDVREVVDRMRWLLGVARPTEPDQAPPAREASVLHAPSHEVVLRSLRSTIVSCCANACTDADIVALASLMTAYNESVRLGWAP